MPESTIGTGTSGSMMIRDIPERGHIEFWIHCSDPYLSIPGMVWGWTADGSTGYSSFNFQSGSQWQMVTLGTIFKTQTVQFHLGATNTYQMGGPTSHQMYIYRAPPPPPPDDGGTDPEPVPVEPSGAAVRVGNAHQRAYAYVNVNGVWKPAEPWVKVAGSWKKTV